MPEIKFCINTRFSRCIEEIRDKGKRVQILLRDPIKTMIVDAEAEAAVLFLSEEDRSTMT